MFISMLDRYIAPGYVAYIDSFESNNFQCVSAQEKLFFGVFQFLSENMCFMCVLLEF